MKTLTCTLAFVFLILPATAGDDLEALSVRVSEAVRKAEGSIVAVNPSARYSRAVPLLSKVPTLGNMFRAGTIYRAADGAKYDALGIRIAGSANRILVPYVVCGTAATIKLIGAQGELIEARRVDGDPDFGLAVFEITAEESDGTVLRLVPTTDWSRLDRGRIAIALSASGGAPALELLGGLSADRTAVRTESKADLLLSPSGELLALRAPGLVPAGQTSVRIPELSNKTEPLKDAARRWAHLAYVASVAPQERWIPGPLIARVMADIEGHGRIRRAFLGVIFGDARGKVVLETVLPETPAARAGLKSGTVIVAFDGQPIANTAAFSRRLLAKRPGDRVTLTPESGDAVEVTLGERTEAPRMRTPEALGIEAIDLSSSLVEYLGLPADARGAVIRRVRAKSAAAVAGLRVGDVVIGGGGGEVANEEELAAVVAAARGVKLALDVRRDGASVSVTIAITDG